MGIFLRFLGLICCIGITVIVIGLAIIVVQVVKEFMKDKRKGGKR